jgi:hypothetical protein
MSWDKHNKNDKIKSFIFYRVTETGEEIYVDFDDTQKCYSELFISLVKKFRGEIPAGKVIGGFALLQ